MLTADAHLNVVHIHEELHGRAYGHEQCPLHQTSPARHRDSRGAGRGDRHGPSGHRHPSPVPLAGVHPHPYTHPQIPYIGGAGARRHPRAPSSSTSVRRGGADGGAPVERSRGWGGRRDRLRPRDQPCHRRCRQGRRWHGAHPARHLPHRRRDPRRPLRGRPARRRQRPYEALRDAEPDRADRRLRLPLRRRQVVLVLGRRPHLACPDGPLGLPGRRDPGEGLALRGLDRQQA